MPLSTSNSVTYGFLYYGVGIVAMMILIRLCDGLHRNINGREGLE